MLMIVCEDLERDSYLVEKLMESARIMRDEYAIQGSLNERQAQGNCVVFFGYDPLGKLSQHMGYRFEGQGYHYYCTYGTNAIRKDYSLRLVSKAILRKAYDNQKKPPFVIDKACSVDKILGAKGLVAADIEGSIDTGVSMIAFCDEELNSVSLPFNDKNLEVITEILSTKRLVWHNGIYDAFTLAYNNGIFAPVNEDTMILQWCINPEGDKKLNDIAALYTDLPYYKDFYHKDPETFAEGNRKDALATMLCFLKQYHIVHDNGNYDYYCKTMDLVEVLLYMQLRGFRIDHLNREKMIERINAVIAQKQDKINQAVKNYYGPKAGSKRKEQNRLNPNSHTAIKAYFKQELGITLDSSDEESLLDVYYKKPKLTIIDDILEVRNGVKQLGFLKAQCNEDGRLRTSFNPVGTDSGRLSSGTLIDGTGANLQVISKDHRVNFIPDDDCDIFQADLAGADAWTVSAECKALGDPLMLNHMLVGLKPAKLVVLMLRGVDIRGKSVEELQQLSKLVSSDDDDYVTAKRVQHGSNYLMQEAKMARQLFLDSRGKVRKTSAECKDIKDIYLQLYYGVRQWQRKVERIIMLGDMTITTASGLSRRFTGRRDFATVRQALAFAPQANTAFATNLALRKLYYDKGNRRPDGSLIIEPLVTVHDSIVGQFPKEHREWACQKIRVYFNNKLKIAGQEITIPFEGTYGKNWKEMEHKI